MPPRQRYYEPEVQVAPPPPPELPPVEGFPVERSGWYLNALDVSAYLARLAEQFHGEGRQALLMAAASFAPAADAEVVEATEGPPEPAQASLAPSYEGSVPVVEGVSRVEVFPNDDGTYWYARPVDAAGNIIGAGIGGVRREALEDESRVRWPGAAIHEVADALSDSVWDERALVSGVRSGFGKPRPSTRRLFT